jgi:tRNA dimethylallyltransferase
MSEKILIISGPTASGKSALALQLANLRDIAIINADSLQIYEGLPILSSQPTNSEQKKAPHFLYSHFKAYETSSVGKWLELVKSIVEDVISQKKLPVIVGGSGMYISKLVDGISKIPEVSEDVRKEAIELYEKLGHQEFLQKYGDGKIIDPQRLIRACAVFLQSGKTMEFWHSQPNEKIFPEAKFTHINLEPNRKKLYENCNLRFSEMLKNGAIEEVENLIKETLKADLSAEASAKADWQITKTLGFAEIRNLLQGEMNKEEMLEIARQKTRNYAKRQLTWFRNQFADKQVFASADEALIFLKNNEI